MAERVYIETTVVSYLTARPNRDVVIAGHQQVTHEWWDTRRGSYELCVSQLVRKEAGAGDSQAAQERLEVLKSMTLLETSDEALDLAKELIQTGAAREGCGRRVAYCGCCHERDFLPVDVELPSSGECYDAALD